MLDLESPIVSTHHFVKQKNHPVAQFTAQLTSSFCRSSSCLRISLWMPFWRRENKPWFVAQAPPEFTWQHNGVCVCNASKRGVFSMWGQKKTLPNKDSYRFSMTVIRQSEGPSDIRYLDVALEVSNWLVNGLSPTYKWGILGWNNPFTNLWS